MVPGQPVARTLQTTGGWAFTFQVLVNRLVRSPAFLAATSTLRVRPLLQVGAAEMVAVLVRLSTWKEHSRFATRPVNWSVGELSSVNGLMGAAAAPRLCGELLPAAMGCRVGVASTPSGASLAKVTAGPPPRTNLLVGPTPLYLLEKLSESIGREVWIKRDDLTPVAMGGNKIRKLEYLLDEADDLDADILITVGAAQSNHARAVAATAAMTGREARLILAGHHGGAPSGNLLLDEMWGATVEFVTEGGWPACLRRAEELGDQMASQGRRPFVIPVGGSTVTGALGYARAYSELVDQGAVGTLVCASGSGGTHAGLMAGFALHRTGPPVVAVQVSQTAQELADMAADLADGVVRRIAAAPVRTAPIAVLDGYLGERYGRPTAAGRHAQRLLMRTEGIVLDDVYTAKAFAAIVAGDERIPPGPVTFIHTGGGPSVFAEPAGPR